MKFVIVVSSLLFLLGGQVSQANECNAGLAHANLMGVSWARGISIMQLAVDMPIEKRNTILDAFPADRTDKGHIAWVKGFRDNIAKENEKIELANEKAAGQGASLTLFVPLTKARPKPVPPRGLPEVFARFNVNSVEGLASLSGAQKAAFDGLGYAITTKTADGNTTYGLEQNINQGPENLNSVLNKKLNGVHGRYADVLVQYFKRKIAEYGASGSDLLTGREIQGLSSQIHDIWMDDAAWKVQPIFQKVYNMPENTFYSLSSADRIGMSIEALSKHSQNLTAEDTQALQQFNVYDRLSEENKRLDDVILLENIQDLLASLQAGRP